MVHARRKLKLAILLTFVSRYSVAHFLTINFVPLKKYPLCGILYGVVHVGWGFGVGPGGGGGGWGGSYI